MNEIEKSLREILSNIAGIVRNESDLIKGLKELAYIMDELNKNDNESIYNLRLIELKSFALINYCVIKSSIMRKESRGTHFRIDYPKEKENLAKTINIIQKDEMISHCYENIK